MKTKKLIILISSIVSLVAFSGCETTSTGGQYVNSQGPEVMVGGSQITITDFYMAADEMVKSLVGSGVLDRAPRQPSILGISDVFNDTREQFDTDLLVKKIRVALNQTGKVVTRMKGEDSLARETVERRAFIDGAESVPDTTPDFTLSGKIIQPALVKDGSKRQNSYVFQLTLTATNLGAIAVWEDEKIITKQYKGGRAVSW